MLHEQHHLALLCPVFGKGDLQIFCRMFQPLLHHFSQTRPNVRTIGHWRMRHPPRARTGTVAHRLQMTMLVGVQHRTNRDTLTEIGIGFFGRNRNQAFVVAANILTHAIGQRRHGLLMLQSEQ